MRNKIQLKTKVTVSAGVGYSPMIAKIASDYNKPNGNYFI